jgi:hypothetical protein
MMNSQRNINPNGVNGASSHARCTSPRSDVVVNQAHHDGQPATGKATRRRYTREDNRAIMECYYSSEPNNIGYRQRMHRAWRERGHFQMDEQRMADQVRNIRKRKWFTDEELDEIKESVLQESEGTNENRNGDEMNQYHNVRQLHGDEDQNDLVGDAMMRIVREPASEMERKLVERITTERNKLAGDQPRLRPLRHVERNKILSEVGQINKAIDCIEINNITELNNTILACAKVITKKMTRKGGQRQFKSEPAWRTRLQMKMKNIRSDLSKVVESRGRDYDDPMRMRLEKKYRIKNKGYDVVIEELKQDLSAVSQKIKRYTERVEQYNQNRKFVNNQKQFYQDLQGNENNTNGEAPDKEESRVFWQGIWSQETTHNTNAEWVNRVQSRLEYVERQEDISITVDDVKVLVKYFEGTYYSVELFTGNSVM